MAIEANIQKLGRQEGRIRELENKIASDKKVFATERDAVKTEKAYILKVNGEIDMKRTQLEEKQIQVAGEVEKLEGKKKEIALSEQQLADKIKQYAGIEQKLKDLAYRESLMEKEKVIDRERKEMLDIREGKISETEARLKRIASG